MHPILSTSENKIPKESDEVSFVANCISTSFGGAAIGGASGNLNWAFAGGIVGVLVAIWSAILHRKRRAQL